MASTQDINVYIKEFPQFCQQEVMPLMASFEQERLEKKKQTASLGWLCLGVAIAAAAIAFIFAKTNTSAVTVTAIGGFGVLIVLFILMSKISKGFETKVKTAVLSKFLSFFGDFSWSFQPKIKKEDVYNSKLFYDFDNFSVDDNFEGTFKGQKVVISEINLAKNVERTRRNSDGTHSRYTESVNIFRGVFAKISLNKNFSTQTVIVDKENFLQKALMGQNNVVNSVLSTLATGNLNIQNMSDPKEWFYKRHKLEPVELEDPEFQKMFDVFAQDQVEARYLLTTSFMERFKLLTKAFNTSAIRASFLDNTITIAVPSMDRDMFTLGALNDSMTDTTAIQEFFKEFISILSLVDLLKLDQKIGL